MTYTSRNETNTWNLFQFHFHAPAEHTIDNQQYDLAMHNVFQKSNGEGQYIVVAILWELDTNAEDDSFITSLNLANVAGTTVPISNVGLSSLYAWTNSQQKFNYQGSITTPGCEELVEWMVVRTIKKINQSQLDLFRTLWASNMSFANGNGNNRLIQDTNRRPVFLIGYEAENTTISTTVVNEEGDKEWVSPVLIVMGLLLCATTSIAIVMTICYLKQNRRKNYTEDTTCYVANTATEVN